MCALMGSGRVGGRVAGRMGYRPRASTMQPASVIETRSTETQRRIDDIET